MSSRSAQVTSILPAWPQIQVSERLVLQHLYTDHVWIHVSYRAGAEYVQVRDGDQGSSRGGTRAAINARRHSARYVSHMSHAYAAHTVSNSLLFSRFAPSFHFCNKIYFMNYVCASSRLCAHNVPADESDGAGLTGVGQDKGRSVPSTRPSRT